jgi:hypothetical protein
MPRPQPCNPGNAVSLSAGAADRSYAAIRSAATYLGSRLAGSAGAGWRHLTVSKSLGTIALRVWLIGLSGELLRPSAASAQTSLWGPDSSSRWPPPIGFLMVGPTRPSHHWLGPAVQLGFRPSRRPTAIALAAGVVYVPAQEASLDPGVRGVEVGLKSHPDGRQCTLYHTCASRWPSPPCISMPEPPRRHNGLLAGQLLLVRGRRLSHGVENRGRRGRQRRFARCARLVDSGWAGRRGGAQRTGRLAYSSAAAPSLRSGLATLIALDDEVKGAVRKLISHASVSPGTGSDLMLTAGEGRVPQKCSSPNAALQCPP